MECEEQVANRFGFAGELYDPVSALIYLRARFYNPVIGRFLQEDNVYEDGLNLYVYCRNNPVRYVDPSGHGTESPADKDGSGKEDHSGDIEALKKIVDEVNAKGGATPDEAAILKKWADEYGVDYDSLGVKMQGDNGNSATKPSGKGGGKPKGNYAKESSDGLKRQNSAANILAAQGYDVTMLDEVQGGNGHGIKSTSNPDLLIENRVFDVYSPGETTSTDTITTTINKKTKTQAERIVLNLEAYGGDADALKNDLLNKTNGDLKHLKELMVIKDGKVETWFVR